MEVVTVGHRDPDTLVTAGQTEKLDWLVRNRTVRWRRHQGIVD